MINYNVSVPESKEIAFQDFLEMIGADYEKNTDEFIISDELKKILDERLKEAQTTFIPARESLDEIREQYEL